MEGGRDFVEIEGLRLRLHSLRDGGVIEITCTAADHEELVAMLVERMWRLRGVLATGISENHNIHPFSIEGADCEIGVRAAVLLGSKRRG
jgi:phosphotransferase system HPr-like phosphotransfer protein